MEPEWIIEQLDEEQAQVARALGGPVVVLAGAGTGKTRAITHRIAYGVALGEHDPQRTLAVTFTNRAAGEMVRRLSGLGVHGTKVRTFHSAALRQLAWAWPYAIGGSIPEVVASKVGLLKSASATLGMSQDRAFIRDIASDIEWAKVSQVTPEDYAQAAVTAGKSAPGGMDLKQVAELYEQYEQVKTDSQRIDFEDVLLLTVGVLESREDLAQPVRKAFRHFTVDEFQDVSALQSRLLDVWLGDRDDVCIVGDPAQTIYSFAGADPSYLQNFGPRFDATTTVRLTRCYRCTPEIVGAANDLLSRENSPDKLVSQKSSGPNVTHVGYDDETAEADGVVNEIKSLIDSGTSPKDIAILVRINAMTQPFESALSARRIPYSVRGSRRFFERPEVRQAIAVLRGASKAMPTAQTPDEFNVGQEARAVLTSLGWNSVPPMTDGAERERWESMSALVTLADQLYVNHPGSTLTDFINELERRREFQDAPELDGVTIASLHAAKGMEWKNVFLAGLSDGVVPYMHAKSPAQVEEERRLLYVGITRAADLLQLSYALTRVPGGRTRPPSRFVPELSQ